MNLKHCIDRKGYCKIPNRVKSIENEEFKNSKMLKEISIPFSVQKIGAGAFKNCSSLTSISLPYSITKVMSGAFDGCTSLKTIECSKRILHYFDPDGDSALAQIGDAYVPAELVVEHETGNRIYNSLKQYINENGQCNLPPSVTKIKSHEFEGCYRLKNISIPKSVKKIGVHAFKGCSSLTGFSIPNSITQIENGTFIGCKSLTKISIPKSITSIGKHAFYGCSSLLEISIPYTVTAIGEYAFYGCSSLIELSIPNAVRYIGCCAFGKCSSINRISLPNSITKIENGTFISCQSLTELFIPKSVTQIGECAFFDCSSLPQISLPNSIIKIGKNAFKYCSLLKNITCNTKLVDRFNSNGNNAEVSMKGTIVPAECIVDSISGKRLYSGLRQRIDEYGKCVIPRSVTKIKKHEFEDCGYLKSISIPNFVKQIGAGAFEGCRNLVQIYIPKSIKQIEEKTFEYCSSLKKIFIPNSVTTIEKDAFKNCSSLKKFYCSPELIRQAIKAGITAEYIVDEIYSDTSKSIYKDGACILYGNITKIKDKEFKGRNDIERIEIPDGVTKIGKQAFEDCENLSEIHLPVTVESVGKDAFNGCKKLSNIHCPRSLMGECFEKNGIAMIKVGDTAVAKNIVTPLKYTSGINTNISQKDAFYCPKNFLLYADAMEYPQKFVIKEVYSDSHKHIYQDGKCVFHQSITEINDTELKNSTANRENKKALINYGRLTEIVIPSSVATVDKDAFKDCKRLNRIQCPENLIKKCVSKSGVYTMKIGDAVVSEEIVIPTKAPFIVKYPPHVSNVDIGEAFSCTGASSMNNDKSTDNHVLVKKLTPLVIPKTSEGNTHGLSE